jgi:hypothetical protein
MLDLTDRETILQIQENMFMQYLNFPAFQFRFKNTENKLFIL